MRPSALTSMLFAAGTFGRPGMVMISPQMTTRNSAPADHYIAHRHERLDQVRAALDELADAPHPEGIAEDELPRRVVEIVYTDVDPVLWGAAELSVRAQLAYLRQ
jgi:hypothetical protein